MKHLDPRKARLGLCIHALCYLLGLPLLWLVNTWTGRPYWVQWVLLGWSIGLLSHWLSVRGNAPRGRQPGMSGTR